MPRHFWVDPMIELRDATFRYAGSERPALNRVSLSFEPGELSLVCGATGSGKSTLLRILNALAPHFTGGELSGTLIVDGVDVTGALPHDLASKVGFVNQHPEASFVADTVKEEIAFGMEQLGFDSHIMKQSVIEIAARLGLEALLDSPISWLSGGQQQRVAIAAALAAGQKILLLDEPTSALDPAAASEIITLLETLAHQDGVTVILAEHRIERVVAVVDSIVIVANDGLVTKGGAEQFRQYPLVPPVIALARNLGWDPLPLSIENARRAWDKNTPKTKPRVAGYTNKEVALEVKDLSVRYVGTEAVSNVSFELNQGEVLAVMGQNGSGKSSLLWAIQGLGPRSAGEVKTKFGDPAALSSEERLCVITMVPQKSADLLFLNSLSDELKESDKFAQQANSATAKIFESLAGRLDPKIHPRDLSAGQQLALVLSLQLVKGAGVLLLDEPTRGLDYAAKRALARLLASISEKGGAILLASHDVEFVSLIANQVIVLKNGKASAKEPVENVLGFGSELATQIAQISRQEGVLTVDEILDSK